MMVQGEVTLPYTVYKAPLIARGYVVFINIRPEQQKPIMYFCDECGERVTPAKQEQHAYKHRAAL